MAYCSKQFMSKALNCTGRNIAQLAVPVSRQEMCCNNTTQCKNYNQSLLANNNVTTQHQLQATVSRVS